MMKFFSLFSVLFLIFQALDISCHAASIKTKKRGWRESYGGNSNVAEFKNIALEMFEYLKKNGENKFNLDYKTISNAINLLEIECKNKLILNNHNKDAINYPQRSPQLLELDCRRWNTQLDSRQKKLLAIHETLPLVGIDDSDYSISNEIFFESKEYLSQKETQKPNLAMIEKIEHLEKNIGAAANHGIPKISVSTIMMHINKNSIPHKLHSGENCKKSEAFISYDSVSNEKPFGFCIDINARAETTWVNAKKNCKAEAKLLAEPFEWAMACSLAKKLGIKFADASTEWIGNSRMEIDHFFFYANGYADQEMHCSTVAFQEAASEKSKEKKYRCIH